MSIFLLSHTKKDLINHLLNENISENQLIKNGFYKYIEDPWINTDGDTMKMVAYSNVKPRLKNGIPTSPISIKKNKVNLEFVDYLKDTLKGKIITYFYRNDTLAYKELSYYFFEQHPNEHLFLKTEKTIDDYYSNLEIPSEKIWGKEIQSPQNLNNIHIKYTINNHETYFYLNNDQNYTTIHTCYLKNEDETAPIVWINRLYRETSPYKLVNK